MIVKKQTDGGAVAKLARWLKLVPARWREPVVDDFLDEEIGRLSRDDLYRVRDLLRSVGIWGATGSGKTRGSGLWLGRSIVSYPRSSGLILAAKPHEDVQMWREIFQWAGRPNDLMIFEPDGELRFNFLDYVVQCGGDTRQITKCITTIGETLRSGEQRGDTEGSYWEGLQEQYLYNAVGIVRLAMGRVTAPELQRFISTAANCRDELHSEAWKKNFHHQCLLAACANVKTPRDAHDVELHCDFWLGQIPGMADRTRSSVEVGVRRWLHVFNTGVVREIVSSETNVTPDDMLQKGKWILVNMPPAQWGDSGSFVNAGWKFLTEWRVLQRKIQPGDFINVIWCDEAQQFINGFDAEYLAVCRSRLGCLVLLTQSLHSYYAAMLGDSGQHRADALISNLYLRIFHALGDADTANWASNQLGKELRTFIGGSMPPEESLYDVVLGRSNVSANFSQSYSEILQPNVFQNGLRTGGPANRFVVDSILVKSGEPFADGRNYLWTSFSQR